VESSWETLEKAVGALATPERSLELAPLATVAAKLPPPGDSEEANGEANAQSVKPPEGNFAQRFPASIFRVAKSDPTLPSTVSPPAAIDGKQKVRVLLLVEQAK
jgi:hypothetical protein